MNFDTNNPIYIQIIKDIKENIIKGNLKENEKLPSIREYCVIYEVTSLTMQRAMSELEREGITKTQKGIGSFVKEGILEKLKLETTSNILENFIQSMEKIGYTKEQIIEKVKEELKNE